MDKSWCEPELRRRGRRVCATARWGRFQESISEDPWLLGAYSSSFLRTFQAADASGTPATISSCKHLVAYSLEGGDKSDDNYTRHSFNAVVSAQDLSESYLPAFHQCVTKGKPGQVMCSCESDHPFTRFGLGSAERHAHTIRSLANLTADADGHGQITPSTACRRARAPTC